MFFTLMHLPENTLRHSFNYNINKKVDILFIFGRKGIIKVVHHSNVFAGERLFVVKNEELNLLKLKLYRIEKIQFLILLF